VTIQFSTDGATWTNKLVAYQMTIASGSWERMVYAFELPATATGFECHINGAAVDTSKDFYFDEIHIDEVTDEDSGCQLVNSSVADCTDTGVIVATSHALIQNNQITGNTEKGLFIAAGYRNIVSGNRCFNNGADTGIANDNQDNFYDAGIDTQVS